ncbi:BRISC and BRCA1-A complex member 2-like isoform X2 [Physella acuta]|uniref:BRISC and BRCA1-A complex member 2-like isoform X2 n=1 Tax=Physella acuta TaxID=109671 RepID=UPI0027DC9B4C|nr:BRISC and BRCA1-A complex member 2-like isoform X2 [Physella acuta]
MAYGYRNKIIDELLHSLTLAMDMRTSYLLQSFDSRFQPYVKYLLLERQKEITWKNEPLQILDPCSGRFPTGLHDTLKVDRFKLKIPYAEQYLLWEVLFDPGHWREPPDFIFNAEDDDFYPPLENIKSIVNWDWSRKEGLAEIVAELLELYKEYQLERASTNINLQRHLRSLLAESPKDMQIIINRTERGLGVTNILVKVVLNYSSLPAYLQQGNPGQDSAVLHAQFPYPDSVSARVQLFLSPAVEAAFGGSSKLQVPIFQPGILLGEYFVMITQLLKRQVQLISDGFDKRKDYISAFVSYFGKAVLEYDVKTFTKVVLLLEWNDFFFTFTVELPLYFPMEHPTFLFKSVYHNQNRKPYVEKHKDFPYSPRWPGTEMAKRAGCHQRLSKILSQ